MICFLCYSLFCEKASAFFNFFAFMLFFCFVKSVLKTSAIDRMFSASYGRLLASYGSKTRVTIVVWSIGCMMLFWYPHHQGIMRTEDSVMEFQAYRILYAVLNGAQIKGIARLLP